MCVIVLYCIVLYYAILYCSTLPPSINPFAANNNINIIIQYENIQQLTQKDLNLLYRALRNFKVAIHSSLKISVLIMVI